MQYATLEQQKAFSEAGPTPFHFLWSMETSDERLFLYCDSAFSPSPEEPLEHLFLCFGQGGELVINYATIGAYG